MKMKLPPPKLGKTLKINESDMLKVNTTMLMTKYGKIRVFDDLCGSFIRIQQHRDRSLTVNEFIGCRDVFQGFKVSEIYKFIYINNIGKRAQGNIVSFFNRLEHKLQIEPRTRFHPTTISNGLYVRMSPWWYSDIRRSLFTILLRIAHRYKGGDKSFNEALFSHRYLKNTKSAVERFLDGYTKLKTPEHTYYSYGWYTQFSYEANKILLIKPDK